jgi:AraC-like DNA-binding protein
VARDADWLVRAPGDLERIEARMSGVAYAPHRHDTYAIALTLEGVQSFDYRGSTWHSQRGQLVILHPDELHDGRAGDGKSFCYRAAYVSPAEIQAILGGTPLPFIESGVSSDPRLRAAVCALLDDYDHPLTGLAYHDALYDLAVALQAASGARRPIATVQREATLRARDYLEAHLDRSLSLEELERATHHDRWQLSRDFRAMFGTSPYRYQILRRLDRARRMMLAGHSPAEAASHCGFADQSHLGRQFKRAFGLTPHGWLDVLAHDRSRPEPRGRAKKRHARPGDPHAESRLPR